tara:strand:- start:1018 stop:1383 length:366 start_codon:yes stop_codon:yes gene_type:complete
VELEVLKKKLSTYRGEGGRVTNVSDELLLEILSAWEQWTGSAHAFYSAIGSNHRKMAKMMGKAKKLRREGHTLPFEEISIEGVTDTNNPAPLVCDIEVQDKNRVIRFRKVDHLVEYLKKAA